MNQQVKKSSRVTHGNSYLKALLVECAWSSILVKDSYLRAKYYQLTSRMGSKKALVAKAHKLLKACWHIIKNKTVYKDIGEPFISKNKKDKITRHYIKKLHQMGYEVQLASN